MKPIFKDEHPIRLGFLGVVLTLTYLTVLLPSGFLESARLKSVDAYCRWRHSLSTPVRELQQILLITIDEESQREMGQKWPWGRKLFADFLTRISSYQPRLVLIDLALVGASGPADDEALAKALQTGPPVLLAAYMDRHGDPVFPLPLFQEAGALTGLINKPRDSDLTVRRLWAAIRLPGQLEPLYALEIKASAVARQVPVDQIKMEKSLWIGSQRVHLEPPGAMAINYLAIPSQIPTVPFWKVVRGEIRPDQVRDRLVLLGSSSEITHDIYPTPLGLMPGVAISANGLLTLLSGRFVRPIPLWLVLLAGLGFVTSILLFTYWSSFLKGLLTTVCLTAGAIGVGFSLVFLDFRAESLSVVVLAVTAWLVGTLYKYLQLLRETVRLHRQVITHPVSRAVTARYFRLRLEAIWTSGKRSGSALSLLLLQTTPLSELLQDHPVEVADQQIRLVGDLFRETAPKGSLAGHLAQDLFGLMLPRVSLQRAKSLAEKLRDALSSKAGRLAFGIASTQQGQGIFSSADDLLRAARAAVARAKTKENGAVEIYDPILDRPFDLAQDRPSSESQRESTKASLPSPLEFVASELEERNRILEQALADLRYVHGQIKSSFLEVTKSLVLALETKDAYTAGHLERVSHYATRLAISMRLAQEEVEAIREAALLHDIGKIGLPDEVLHKVGKLMQEEHQIIRQHLEIGAKILEPMKFFKSITTLIYHHHEWYNGQGYPHGLAGDFIPAGAQVIAIADSYDAMTTYRGYNPPLTAQEAMAELRKGANAQFNPLYVEAFAELITREGPQLEETSEDRSNATDQRH